MVSQIKNLLQEIHQTIEKHGTGREWILADLPEKDVVFTKGMKSINTRRFRASLYQERDPVKIVDKNGNPSLLVERENTLMKHLSGFINFVPSVYANDQALELLRKRGIMEK